MRILFSKNVGIVSSHFDKLNFIEINTKILILKLFDEHYFDNFVSKIVSITCYANYFDYFSSTVVRISYICSSYR